MRCCCGAACPGALVLATTDCDMAQGASASIAACTHKPALCLRCLLIMLP